jgi:3-phosphoshikimate 1-carboxyvinyltransferase
LAQSHPALTAKMASKFRVWALDSIQGDIRFVEAAQAMGAAVTGGPNWLQIERGAWPLKAIDLDCNHIPTPP